MRTTLFVISVAALLWVQPASAEWTTTQLLANYYSLDTFSRGVAVGTLAGAEDVFGYVNADLQNKKQPKIYCQPQIGLGDQQIMLILQNFVKVKPYMGKYPIGVTLRYALIEAFPCGKVNN